MGFDCINLVPDYCFHFTQPFLVLYIFIPDLVHLIQMRHLLRAKR